MSEMDEFDILAENNRKRFAQEGEVFGRNFILGLDYKTLDEAKSVIEGENSGMAARFEQENVVTGDGTILSGQKYAEIEVLGFGVKNNMSGVAVYLKPKV